MKVKVFAKLNLSLNVYERQGEFHPIDSVVTSVDVCDTVAVKLRNDNSIFVLCDNAEIPALHNSAYLAAVEFQQAFHTCGCSINIRKGIPMGAGMGGSSADAAAVIYCLCKLHKVPLNSAQVHDVCAKIGSDVNFMLRGGLARVTGKGDDVESYGMRRPLYFAVTTFPTQMNTGEVYKAFDNLQKKAENYCDNRRLLASVSSGMAMQDDFQFAAKKPTLNFCNMLQPAALSLSAYANDYLAFCAERGISTTMTGSGSAFFVACRSKSDAVITQKLLVANGFNTQVCRSVPCGIKRLIF